MVKTRKPIFVCSDCGAIYPKWQGRCDDCGAWNTLTEEQASEIVPKGLSGGKGGKIAFVGLKGDAAAPPRARTGIGEFDRVTGGGLVPASVILLGGDPGIGKSTILMQVAAALSGREEVLYISGEEAIDQLRLRAERLGLAEASAKLATATSVRDIVATLDRGPAPGLVIVDSIQTMYVDNVESAPGTVGQVRASGSELIRLAKRRGFCLILVGHVTKEGAIAGPRVLEHMVDCVLYFEGERGHQFRILRSVKNRHGATDEIGVFEMADGGLLEVPNPSALFLADHDRDATGAGVFAGLEGTRPMLVEIQSLLAPSALATPRRAVVGWDSGRLAMVMAVMESRCGFSIAGNDVYLNIAGGLKIREPAADLAAAAALTSASNGAPLPRETVIFGEVGLSGEIRPVAGASTRLKEAAKLGFKRALLPTARNKKGGAEPDGETLGMEIVELSHLNDLVVMLSDDARLRETEVAFG